MLKNKSRGWSWSSLKRATQRWLLAAAIGVSSGLLCALFLHSLQFVTRLRLEHPSLIYGLPFVGFLIPWIYRRFGGGSERGLGRVLEEIHGPRQVIVWAMAPLIYLTTLLSHLVGASTGREGTALQISASFADQLARRFRIIQQERPWVLMAALSGGFSAALGAPWAGLIFGLEVIVVGRVNRKTMVECGLASFVAWWISVAMKAPHFVRFEIAVPDFQFLLLFHLLGLSIALGLFSRLHVEGVRRVERLFAFFPVLWRTAVGGAFLLGLYLWFPLSSYQGLGLETIREALTSSSGLDKPFIKLALTVFSLGVGFKGGEFIPLVFMGCTLGSAWSTLWHEPTGFFAALGFATLFGAAAKTPLTVAVLTAEFFGWSLFPYALLVSYGAFATAGPFGIYAGQRIIKKTKN